MRTRATLNVFIVLLMTFPAGCSDQPARPTEVVANPPGPPPPLSEPTVSEVVIEGPETVPIGETTEFRMIATMTDGAVRDLTDTAEWLGSDQVAFAGPGLARGITKGDASIGARSSAGHAGKEVIVVPRGTYRLTGEIRHVDSGPVVGAIVEVRRGVGTGLRTSTTVSGEFRLYGVAGQVTLRVFNPGYEVVDGTITIDDHQHVEIPLPLLKPRFDVSGTYTLTIGAAAVCMNSTGPNPLPDEARTRTYTADISQEGATLRVSLSGAAFIDGADQFRGRVEPGLVVFDLLPWYEEELPSIAELSPSLGTIIIDGSAAVTPSAQGFSGNFSGRIGLYRNELTVDPVARCYSTSHRFVLSR